MTRVFGFDFTSAPSRRKSITRCTGTLRPDPANQSWSLDVVAVDALSSFDAFETALAIPGPWVAAFDFPFGLPRELSEQVGWPNDWRAHVRHVRSIGKLQFVATLNRVRESRPYGSRYIARRGDEAAGSSSPMKLVNPPVGLMFFEGTPRLLEAGLTVIPCAPSSDSRIALEAYPGYLARQVTKRSYKSEGAAGRGNERTAARQAILDAIVKGGQLTHGIIVKIAQDLIQASLDDGRGDTLDAIICALQAAMSARAFALGDAHYGIPQRADSLEGWIATVT